MLLKTFQISAEFINKCATAVYEMNPYEKLDRNCRIFFEWGLGLEKIILKVELIWYAPRLPNEFSNKFSQKTEPPVKENYFTITIV